MKSLNSAYVPAVDHIRAFAATLVILQHCHVFIGGRLTHGPGGSLAGVPARTPFDALVIEGHTGVSLFMVLSGFIFTHIAYGKDIRYGPFLLNRFLRIYPLLIAIFTVGFLVEYPKVSPMGFVAVLTIPFQLAGPIDFWFVPSIHPFTTLFWTIAPEFQFYLLFPLLLPLLHRYGLPILAAGLASAVVLRIVLFANGIAVADLAYWTLFGRIDQFLIGMGAAVVYRASAEKRLAGLAIAAIAALPLLLFAFNRAGGLELEAGWKVVWPTAEGLLWAAFILGYLQLAMLFPGWLSRGLAHVGEVSFSMYLLHVAVIAAAIKLGPLTFGLGPSDASIANALLLVLPGTIAISWVTFRLIERPFLRLRVRYLIDQQPDRTDQSAKRSEHLGATK